MSEEYGKASPPRGRSRSEGRSQPYDSRRSRDRSRDRESERDSSRKRYSQSQFECPSNALKVSSATDAKELADDILKAVDRGESPALLTIGHAAINQAVKGIAIAAQDLKELSFQPVFRHENRTKALLAFYTSTKKVRDRIDRGEDIKLTATADQKIISLAGAIAGKVREHQRVYVVAVGRDAVSNAVLAICNARLFLEGNRLDIKVSPEFVKVTKYNKEMGDHQLNVMRFNIIPERI